MGECISTTVATILCCINRTKIPETDSNANLQSIYRFNVGGIWREEGMKENEKEYANCGAYSTGFPSSNSMVREIKSGRCVGKGYTSNIGTVMYSQKT